MAYKIWGLKPRNEEQKETIKHLLDPEIDLVVLEGIAGSGKTLLALAAGLEQVIEKHMYTEIIFTRAPVGVGEDIGFLPGTEEEKMTPWAGALMDNLEMLLNSRTSNKVQKTGTSLILEQKIKIRAMQFMRGRSFANRYVIIDEIQNLTPGQLKVLITRAGEGCKIVCMGDLDQIDNRRLTRETCGLNVLIHQAMDVDFIKVVNLPGCERSRLAAWAAEVL